jgi:GNAT superfamily N-acetyltransferase
VARPDELALLPALERAADRVFEGPELRRRGFGPMPGPGSVEDLERALVVLVAGDPPMGFARVDEVDGSAHLEQLSVHPDHHRQGVGRALLEAACAWAADADYAQMTLITFGEVAFNGPFYAAAGFVPTEARTPGLVELRAQDRRDGLDGYGVRQVMARTLGRAGGSGSSR